MKFFFSLLFLFTSLFASAQEKKPSSFSLGLEQDLLPYALKGYIITGWMGRDQFRHRFSYAKAVQPEMLNDAGIKSDEVNAFGISFEYFFRDEFKGWWLGPGVGYWTNRAVTDSLVRIKNESVIFSLGGGYNFTIWKGLYGSPWIATHFRVSGIDDIAAVNAVYSPNLFTPELSFKLGYRFCFKKKQKSS